jgi:FhuF 2Fe-2S C-terminal domain
VPDDLAALGPFFAVHSHPPGQAPAAPWRPVSELAAAGGPLGERVAAVRAVLAARGGRPVSQIDPRVAASAAHLGLVARLVAPALAAAALGQHLDMRLDGLWWQAHLGGPVPLSVPVTNGGPVPRDWHHQLLAGVIDPLTTATSRLISVSDRVLRGNVASGINAAAGQVATSRPLLADRAWAAARALFASPWLAREPGPPGPAFRRASCCLFYRLSPGSRAAICGDCVLGAAPAAR